MRAHWAVFVFLIASSFGESQIALPVCCDQELSIEDPDYEEKCYNLFKSKWNGHTSNWEYRYSATMCNVWGVGTFYEETKFEIDEFGKLILPASKDSCGIFTPSFHQVNWTEHNASMSNSQFCMDRVNHTFGAYICTESGVNSEGTNYSNTPLLGQPICMIISAFCLMITSGIHLTVKTRKDKNLEFVPYLVSQSISLAVAFICDARLLFSPLVTVCWECMLAGYCVQYFFLAAFFWMNAFCIMMYMTMSQTKAGNYKNPKATRRRQRSFIRFSFYAWGMPLLISTTTFLLQMTIIDPGMRPSLGVDFCFFQDSRWQITKSAVIVWLVSSHSPTFIIIIVIYLLFPVELMIFVPFKSSALIGGVIKWIYYDGPIAVVIIANIILFALTASILANQHRRLVNMKSSRKRKSRLNKEIQYFNRYLKLFIVTGFGWIGEVLGSCFPNHTDPLVWYALKAADFFNCLQGVFIFFFFICQDKVLFNRLFCVPKNCKLRSRSPSKGIVLRCCFAPSSSNTQSPPTRDTTSAYSGPEASEQENH